MATPFSVMAKPVGPVCNLDCAYCYYLGKEALYPAGQRFRMDDDTLATFIRQYIESHPGPTVHFVWHGGEPTLMGIDFYRRVVALQQLYRPQGWKVSNAIQTNGVTLTDEWCAFFKAHRFLVGISIDGPAHLHDRYRVDKGGRPTHARVIAGLRSLQRHGVEYNVLCVLNRLNARHPDEVYVFLTDLGARYLQFIPLVEHVGGGQVTARSVSAIDYGQFLSTVFRRWVRRDVGRVYVQIFEEAFRMVLGYRANLCVCRETCGDGVVLEHDGTVFACDHFVTPEHRLGNIHTTPLAEMIRSARQLAFGRAKRTALPSCCRSCEVRYLCHGGCPKDRINDSPDGEPGLNYLCAGYKRFFTEVEPILKRMAVLYRAGLPPALIMQQIAADEAHQWPKAGRNDPCPCGSGRKFKRCCLAVGSDGGNSHALERTRPTPDEERPRRRIGRRPGS